ncbi:hypothetical protein TGPRC2_427290 [Toxoplasma gondii TgCatPRC2]|nr:hypothetical protein TGPRC2_427290 [Toxoplasma gondii TgCatPRC2]
MTTTGFAFEAAVLPTDVMERISSTAEPHPPKANIQTETPKPMRYPPSSKAKTHFEGSNDLGSVRPRSSLSPVAKSAANSNAAATSTVYGVARTRGS